MEEGRGSSTRAGGRGRRQRSSGGGACPVGTLANQNRRPETTPSHRLLSPPSSPSLHPVHLVSPASFYASRLRCIFVCCSISRCTSAGFCYRICRPCISQARAPDENITHPASCFTDPPPSIEVSANGIGLPSALLHIPQTRTGPPAARSPTSHHFDRRAGRLCPRFCRRNLSCTECVCPPTGLPCRQRASGCLNGCEHFPGSC
ncbi:hypothetical protein BD311DRAFT_255887 [Dichomitus squalens]|uniref:Uncharacterized protein n=1 Tax=Dichomitus squalens TaxID=114155 RepID=A0A4Q9MQ19_9APHY|nr:hypothetical protein BD311DRAFT_255887 [Dichomitus squalens]